MTQNSPYHIFLINEYLLNQLRRIYRSFHGDMECALILGEIGHFNVKMDFMARNPNVRGADMDDDGLRSVQGRGCNAYSISLSTGIPRETVRRKLVKLQKAGWISTDEKGRLFITVEVCQAFSDHEAATLSDFMAVIGNIEKTRLPSVEA